MIEIIPTLKSTRLILRAFTLNDANDVFAYAKNEVVSKYVFWNTHQTIEDSINFIKETIIAYEKDYSLTWAIQLKNEKKVIGTCSFISHNKITKSLKLGYALNQDYWHKGYIKEALETIIAYAFTSLDVIRIEGICVTENIASAKTMLSCGMQFEGILHDGFIKDNKIYDCKLFAVTKRNFLKTTKNSQYNH